MIDYRIISRENYSNKIGELVTMLEHTRDVTLSEISNLNQSDLDFFQTVVQTLLVLSYHILQRWSLFIKLSRLKKEI